MLRLRYCLLLSPLVLSSCFSTAVGLTAGAVKVTAAAVTLPVKAAASVAGAALGDDCEDEPEECVADED